MVTTHFVNVLFNLEAIRYKKYNTIQFFNVNTSISGCALILFYNQSCIILVIMMEMLKY